MSRSHVLSLVVVVVGAAFVLAGCRGAPAPPRADGPPDIVLVLADDMGFGDPACFNAGSRIPTPHIDLLAEEGMRFTDAHAPGAWCVPSRYGLMTGVYPCRPRRFYPGQRPVIEADQATLASFLRDQGYATAMVGKWHLGFEGGPATEGQELHGGPLDRGFDRFFGIHASLDIPPYFYIRDRTPVASPTGSVEASGTDGWTNIQGAFWRAGAIAPGFEHSDVLPRFTGEAITYLDEMAADEDTPFFLYVALAAPHTPWLPDASFRGRSEADLYGDFVAQVDHAVGELMTALERSGRGDRTLFFFTSDNGPVWYPDDVERLGHRATGPFRGMKSDAWEGGHRMPFVVRWPGLVAPRSVSDRTLCFTDFLATAADLVGAPLSPGAGPDSHSFLPVLLDPTAATTRETTVLKADASVIRHGEWKLITHLGSGGFSRPRREEPEPDGPEGQLYDLAADPGETTNLWNDRPDVVARLTALLAPYLEEDPLRVAPPK